jgi:PAS domain-containing protein
MNGSELSLTTRPTTRTRAGGLPDVTDGASLPTVAESTPSADSPAGCSADRSTGGSRDYEERLLSRSLIAALPVPLLSTDAHGRVVQANPAAACLLDATVSTLEREPVFHRLDEDSRRDGQALLEKAVRTRRDVRGSLVVLPPGRQVACQVTLVPAVSVDHEPAAAHEEPVVNLVRWVIVPARDAPPDTTGTSTTVPDAALAELCRLGIGQADLRTLLSRVTEFACRGLPGVDAASIVLGDPLEPAVLASSSTVAQAGDAVQHYAGRGPVFDAYHHARPAGTDDLIHDPRWSLSRVNGVDPLARRCLALPFTLAGGVIGVLALYGEEKLAADTLAARARPYLATAETLVRDSRLLAEVVTTRDQLQEALTSRSEIDQAKGIIMAIRRCSADEAFFLLTRMSNTTHRKVRDIARDLTAQAVGDGMPLPAPYPASRHRRPRTS